MDDNSYNENLELFLKAVESVKSSGYDAYTEDAKKGLVPVGISNHHVHLTTEAVEVLFGKDYMLERIKNLSQPGQFACKECVTLRTYPERRLGYPPALTSGSCRNDRAAPRKAWSCPHPHAPECLLPVFSFCQIL